MEKKIETLEEFFKRIKGIRVLGDEDKERLEALPITAFTNIPVWITETAFIELMGNGELKVCGIGSSVLGDKEIAVTCEGIMDVPEKQGIVMMLMKELYQNSALRTFLLSPLDPGDKEKGIPAEKIIGGLMADHEDTHLSDIGDFITEYYLEGLWEEIIKGMDGGKEVMKRLLRPVAHKTALLNYEFSGQLYWLLQGFRAVELGGEV